MRAPSNPSTDTDRLRKLAYEDALTGLPNRQAALEWLEQTLQQDQRMPLLILNLDLDNFQWVNNTFGRDQADEVIRAFAQLLTLQVQSEGMVARLQSDEFLVILPLADGPDHSPIDHRPDLILQELRRSLIASLEERQDLPYVPTFCIGYRFHAGAADSMPPVQPVDTTQMLQDVNTALSQARRSGVNRQALYVPEMSQMIEMQLQMEAKLTQAWHRQELTLYYQPIVRLDGVIVAVEVLMRWPQADGSFIPPSRFIPLLEKSGMIVEVGRWLINAACTQMALWRQKGLSLDYMSINISAAQLISREFSLYQDLMEAIRCHQLPAAALQLEITESAVLDNIELVKVELERVASSGFSIALDDFGTGYSSLLTLLQLPINGLKIDKNFVDEVDTRFESLTLVEMCMSLARRLSLHCVAEGVESEYQYIQLRKIGCQYFQGYLFDQPLPPEEMEERLLRQQLAS